MEALGSSYHLIVGHGAAMVQWRMLRLSGYDAAMVQWRMLRLSGHDAALLFRGQRSPVSVVQPVNRLTVDL